MGEAPSGQEPLERKMPFSFQSLQMFPDAKPHDGVKYSHSVDCLGAMLQNSRTGSQSMFLMNAWAGLGRIYRMNHHAAPHVLPVTLCPHQIITCTRHIGEDKPQSSLWWLANTVALVCVAKYLKFQCDVQNGTNFPRRRNSTFYSSLWPKVRILSTHSYVGSEPGP